MEETYIFPRSAWIQEVSITNKTGHVVRLNMTSIALFDPADNQYDLLSKDELAAYTMQERPCSSTKLLMNNQKTIKLLGRNTELLPNRTYKGNLIFMTLKEATTMTGIWKISLYEVPVETNAAGVTSKTVNFEFKTDAKKYIDTYRRENAFEDWVKISTEEVK